MFLTSYFLEILREFQNNKVFSTKKDENRRVFFGGGNLLKIFSLISQVHFFPKRGGI